jgi:hypothetical protein
MIGIMLLALPIVCLLIGVAYFSVSLWKLNKKTISLTVAKSSGATPIIIEEDGAKIIPQLLTISDDIQIANSYELDEETLNILLYTVLLKQHEKISKLDNLDVAIQNSMVNSIDIYLSSKQLKKHAKATMFDNAFQNKEKFLCQLQNLG